MTTRFSFFCNRPMGASPPWSPCVAVLAVAATIVSGVACDDSISGPELSGTVLFAQSFESGVEGWADRSAPGPTGWCGEIVRVTGDDGPVSPADGTAYALLEQGPCNQFWTDMGFVESAPYGGGGFTAEWPEGGFVHEIAVYLDTGWASGTRVGYAVSFQDLTIEQFGPNIRYLMFDILRTDGGFTVAGRTIAEAGWYTIRTRFRDDGGRLEVVHEILQDGDVLHGIPAEEAVHFEGPQQIVEPVSSFSTEDVGTGYVWFSGITTGVELAVDAQQVVRLD